MIARALAAALAATLVVAAPASAHIQVHPTLVAPGDPVQFTLLVPGERDDAQTTAVTLQVPADVLPFAWGETPGWRRTVKLNPNQSISTVTWTGKLAKDGFATFSFLASTPAKGTEIVWKALQKYSNGETVRWIGAPGSDNPAAVTTISKDAPKQNAGGEGGAASSATPAATAESVSSPVAAVDPPSDNSDSPLPLILSALALALAAVALLLTLRRSR